LEPTRAAAEQHRLGARERERNVGNLFTCRSVMPERVVLVDDLLTSGATASAAAAALRAAGARTVILACLARTPKSEDAFSDRPTA
ncbi:MAG: ComF family protein, partial [Planctomycetes bacterium]|nr:ComF family protein [Planctomycetota bacterium]